MDAAPLALSGPRGLIAFALAAAVHLSLALALGNAGPHASISSRPSRPVVVSVAIHPVVLEPVAAAPVARAAPARSASAGVPHRARVAALSPERPEPPLTQPRLEEAKPAPPAAPSTPTVREEAPRPSGARETLALAIPAAAAPQLRMPALLDAPAPAYPTAAREDGEEGTVLLRVRVSPAGGAAEVALARSSGSRLLDAAALTAVARWTFRPARRGDEAIEAWLEVPVRFQLR
jgi:periplasmic protein TonB